jgi:pimeloyl-ACP methyl ester carboxylesterase
MMELWHEIRGDGEPLLLIHGMGSSHTAWQLVVPELSKRFKVITVDLPGHGFSKLPGGTRMDPPSLAQLLLAQMNAWGFETFHVAGNSLGGWVALEMAAATPTRIRTLTGIAPAGLWLVPETTREPLGAIPRYMASTTHAVAPQLLRFRWARKIGFSQVSPQWESLPLQVCVDAARAIGTSSGYFPAWDAMLGLRFDKEIDADIPITILFGDTDNTLPAQYSQERSLVPAHARWVLLPQCGHAPMWDRAPEVIAEIEFTTAQA